VGYPKSHNSGACGEEYVSHKINKIKVFGSGTVTLYYKAINQVFCFCFLPSLQLHD
jgi:hypothetical protein